MGDGLAVEGVREIPSHAAEGDVLLNRAPALQPCDLEKMLPRAQLHVLVACLHARCSSMIEAPRRKVESDNSMGGTPCRHTSSAHPCNDGSSSKYTMS